MGKSLFYEALEITPKMLCANNKPNNNSEIDTPDEEKRFYIKTRVAIIKSVILGGFGAMTWISGNLGSAVINPAVLEPKTLVIGATISFLLGFFTKLRQELKL